MPSPPQNNATTYTLLFQGAAEDGGDVALRNSAQRDCKQLSFLVPAGLLQAGTYSVVLLDNAGGTPIGFSSSQRITVLEASLVFLASQQTSLALDESDFELIARLEGPALCVIKADIVFSEPSICQVCAPCTAHIRSLRELASCFCELAADLHDAAWPQHPPTLSSSKMPDSMCNKLWSTCHRRDVSPGILTLQVETTTVQWQPGSTQPRSISVKLLDVPLQQKLLVGLDNVISATVHPNKNYTLVTVAAPVFSYSTGQASDVEPCCMTLTCACTDAWVASPAF